MISLRWPLLASVHIRLFIYDSNEVPDLIYQLVFWRVALNAITQQTDYIVSQIADKKVTTLVATSESKVVGFADLLHQVRNAALSRGTAQVVVGCPTKIQSVTRLQSPNLNTLHEFFELNQEPKLLQ